MFAFSQPDFDKIVKFQSFMPTTFSNDEIRMGELCYLLFILNLFVKVHFCDGIATVDWWIVDKDHRNK